MVPEPGTRDLQALPSCSVEDRRDSVLSTASRTSTSSHTEAKYIHLGMYKVRRRSNADPSEDGNIISRRVSHMSIPNCSVEDRRDSALSITSRTSMSSNNAKYIHLGMYKVKRGSSVDQSVDGKTSSTRASSMSTMKNGDIDPQSQSRNSSIDNNFGPTKL